MKSLENSPVLWRIDVAISEASYAYDKIYTYVSSEEIVRGCRVVVPFGKGNNRRIGIVFSCAPLEEMQHQLKAVSIIIDREPIMPDELLDLAIWLKETTFCTYYDAIRAILPAGMQAYLVEDIALAQDPPDVPLEEGESSLYYYLKESHTQQEYHHILTEADDATIQALLDKGYLLHVDKVKERTSGQSCTNMVRLTPQSKELPTTKTQKKVIALLEETDSISEREACYLAGVSKYTINKMADQGLIEKYKTKPELNPYLNPTEKVEDPESLCLTSEQQAAYQQVADALDQGARCFLLHGVTGSGKTCIYIRLIDTVIRQGKQVMVLVPEIALTPQTVSQFCRYFGNQVAVIHSELTLGQRNETWEKILNGEFPIVVGTRSAVFSPLTHLGLIIVDEEGERTYKSDQAPRYHAITVAKKRCQTHQCPLVLASATPSIESYYHAQRGLYTLLELKERYNQAPLPEVEIVDMQAQATMGADGLFSASLVEALRDNLQSGNQSLLLLNRRGYHTIIRCISCNQPIYCPNCSVPMTYHKTTDSLMCHYCGYTTTMPKVCPYCGSPQLRRMGFGTQRVEEELSTLLPSARILRMDADTTVSRSAYMEKFSAFREGQYDILLGTQMIGKGLDFPNVTLVGVLSVDKALYAGDFRSYERTFSLITQVVGRSGRGEKPGRAILQTNMPDHYVLRLAARQDYPAFYEQEIALRRQLIFPPICDICIFGFTGLYENDVKDAAYLTAQILKDKLKEQNFSYPIWVLDPVPCIYEKINNKYRYQLVIKCKNTKPYRDVFQSVLSEVCVDHRCNKVHIFIDFNGDIG